MLRLKEALKLASEDLRIEAVKASKEIIIGALKFQEKGKYVHDYVVPVVAYLLLKVGKYAMPFIKLEGLMAQEGFSEERKKFIRKCVKVEAWDECNNMVTRYDEEVYKELILNYENYLGIRRRNNTPPSLVKLAKAILKPEAGERVTDLCCGDGSFLLDAAEEVKTNYYGFDADEEVVELLKLRAEILGVDVNAAASNAFNLFKGETAEESINEAGTCTQESFDKIFCRCPLAYDNVQEGKVNQPFMETPEVKNLFKKATSSDWLFSLLAAKLLTPQGKAVIVVKTGSCSNVADRLIRKYLIDAGLVETVISLPAGLLSIPHLSVTMVVLSKGNSSVRMINASEIFQRGRRRNELSDENIAAILQACEEDGEYSILVDAEVLHENESAYSPERYLVHKLQFENGVALGDLIITVKRGVIIKAAQLDELATEEEGNIRYLRLSDMQNGIIENGLPYMTHVDKKYSSSLLDSLDLVISKLASPYKCAVVEKAEEEQILPVGNMYALELDKERIDPYYLQAFLESDLGIASLKTITTGTTVPIISVDRLKTLQIPLPSMEEQKRIAEKLFNNLTEVRKIKMQLDEAVKRIPLIFEES